MLFSILPGMSQRRTSIQGGPGKATWRCIETYWKLPKKSEVPIFINGSSIHAGTGDISAYTVEASLEDTPETL